MNFDEVSPGLPGKSKTQSLQRLLLKNTQRGFSDSQIQKIAPRKAYFDLDNDDDFTMPQQSQLDGNAKSANNMSLKIKPSFINKFKDPCSLTIEEENIETKSSLETVCSTFEDRLLQLGLPTTHKTMSTPSQFSPSLSLIDEKSGNDNSNNENAKEHFDYQNLSAKYYNMVLPVIKNIRDPELTTITHQTLVELIDNPKDLTFLIVDCRYEYEYEGGHIKGAINLTSLELLEKVFWTERTLLYNKTAVEDMKKDLKTAIYNPRNYKPFEKDSSILNPPILIFHCEFSQERGPKAMRTLRNQDRNLNANRFPQLYYPQIYLLEEGYSQFHKKYPTYCDPENGYVEMHSPEYKQDYALAKEREKKSWKKKFSIDIQPTIQGIRAPHADFQY